MEEGIKVQTMSTAATLECRTCKKHEMTLCTQANLPGNEAGLGKQIVAEGRQRVTLCDYVELEGIKVEGAVGIFQHRLHL